MEVSGMAGRLFFLGILVLAASGALGENVREGSVSSVDAAGEENDVQNYSEEEVLFGADSADSDSEFGSTEENEDLFSEDNEDLFSGMEVLHVDAEEDIEEEKLSRASESEVSERMLGGDSLTAMSAKDYVANFALQRQNRKHTAGGAGRMVRRGKAKTGNRPGKKGKRTPEARLRAAIRTANKNPGVAVVITLTKDVLLSSSLPLLIGTLGVVGSCTTVAGKVRACVIDGQNKYPIFRASLHAAPCTVIIRNLILQNAKGGAYTGDPTNDTPASCNLVARGVVFRNNVNTLGGAIYMLGTYNIQRCIFENNAAEGDGGAILAGDAFGFYLAPALGSYVAADGIITQTVFRNNRAGTRPSRFSLGNGGAIAHFGGPTVKIRTSVFDSNKALGNGTNGGAVHFRGGDNITFVRSSFKSNSASVAGAVYAAPLLQFNQWAQPVGPNIWGTARFCRTIFGGNSASKRFPDVAVAGTYAFDIGKVKALFCPRIPPGYGALDPAKVVAPAKKGACGACYKA